MSFSHSSLMVRFVQTLTAEDGSSWLMQRQTMVVLRHEVGESTRTHAYTAEICISVISDIPFSSAIRRARFIAETPLFSGVSLIFILKGMPLSLTSLETHILK